MATYSNNLRITEITPGDETDAWGGTTNDNLQFIADAFGYGTKQMAADADETFTMANGSSDTLRSLYLSITSAVSLTATRTVTLAPNDVSKVWIIYNATTGSQSIVIKQGSGATVTIPNGTAVMVATDGAGSGAAVTDLYAASNFKIGVSIQAYNTALQSISGLTTAADKMIYTTALNVYAVTDLTVFGRSLLDDADATTARTTLGLGTSATVNVGTSGATIPLLSTANTFSAIQTTKGTRMTLNAVAALDIDWGSADYHTKSISANTVFTFSNVPSGTAGAIVVRVTVSGSRTITWPAGVVWPESLAPSLTGDRTHLFMFSTDNGTVIRGAYLTNYTA